MTTLEVARIVGELAGVMIFVSSVGVYVVRQVWRLLDSVETLTRETKTLTASSNNTTALITAHANLDEARYLEISNRLSRIEGRLGLEPSEGMKP